jgi:regulator of protease activity HflC (stomatin/prohibitin superfamily)
MTIDERGNRMEDKKGSVDLETLEKFRGGGLIWLGLALLLVIIFLFNTIRIGRVTGEQVGIMLSKITGKITVIHQSGAKIYNGFTNEFYVLDKTLQTLDMSGGLGEGKDKRRIRQDKEPLKVKTIDGSDVYVALKVQYKITPALADVVVRTSGLDDNYKKKWARDYIRSKCRNYLGELTTEEFYDASKRDVKVLQAQKDANERLGPFGIEIDSIRRDDKEEEARGSGSVGREVQSAGSKTSTEDTHRGRDKQEKCWD